MADCSSAPPARTSGCAPPSPSTANPAPPPGARTRPEAADFDEQSGVEIVDRTRTSGDAVTAAPGRSGELVYRSCDFGDGVREVTAAVSGDGVAEICLDGGPALAVLAPDTPASGPYDYTAVRPDFTAGGVHDVRLKLRGPLRLARVGFSG